MSLAATALSLAFATGLAGSALAGSLVYVPLGTPGEVAVIDDATDAIVGTIEGLPAVHGLAGTPDGSLLIAGSFEERSPGEAMPERPANVSEDEHAVHHGGAAAAAAPMPGMVSTVSVVRTSDNSVIRRIDVPGSVHHVSVSPDGRFAAVTHPSGGTISAIDMTSFKVVATVETGPLPNYSVFSPDSSVLYVSNAGNDTVSKLDTAGWKTTGSVTVGKSPEHVVMSPDGGTLYVNNVDDGTVSIVDAAAFKVSDVLLVGSLLHGIGISDDGKRLFVAALGDDKLVRYDLTTMTEKEAALGPGPYHLAVLRGGAKLYVSSDDDPKIWVVDADTLSVLKEIEIEGKGHQMVQGPGA